MQKFETKSIGIYFLWMGCFGAALILLPYYLGSLIAQNQWQMLVLLALGLAVMTLYFIDERYLIFCVAASLVFADSQAPGFLVFFGKLRWVLLVALALRAMANWIVGRVPTRVRRVDLLALAFLALAFYSQSYSILPELTFQRSVALSLFYVAVFWGVWGYVQDEAKIPVVINDLLKLSFFILLAGPLFGLKGRFSGFFASPNGLGLFSALLMPLIFWSYLCERKQAAFYLLILMGASLFLSGSRAGIISTVIGAGYFLVSYYRKLRYLVITCLIFFVGFAVLYMQIFGSSLFEQYLRWDSFMVGSGRLEAWKEMFRLIQSRPWFGYGFGTEDHLFLKFDIVFLEHAGAYAHNSYMGLASQLGLIGVLLLYVPLGFFFLRSLFRLSRLSESDSDWLRLALNASILAGLVDAMFESWIYSAGNAYAFLFWVVVTLAYQLDRASSTDRLRNLAVVSRTGS